MNDEQLRSLVGRFKTAIDSATKEELEDSLMCTENNTLDIYKVTDERLEELLDASVFNNSIDDNDTLGDIFDALRELKHFRETCPEVAISIRAGAVIEANASDPRTKVFIVDFDLMDDEEIEERKRREERIKKTNMKRIFFDRP